MCGVFRLVFQKAFNRSVFVVARVPGGVRLCRRWLRSSRLLSPLLASRAPGVVWVVQNDEQYEQQRADEHERGVKLRRDVLHRVCDQLKRRGAWARFRCIA